MNSYSFEDIEKLAADTGMRTLIYNGYVHIFLGEYRISAFRKMFKDASVYELQWTYTKVTEYHIAGHINFMDSVSGRLFFGDLHAVYENMSKKYKELLKMIKAAEIKNCGGEYVIG